MLDDGKVKFLSECLDKNITSFNQWSDNNKKKAFLLKMFVTSFSAITTILLGLQGIEGTRVLVFNSPTLVKNVALILSAFVTLFTTWDAFFNHRALWINQTNSANQLKAIKSELDFFISGGGENLKAGEIDRLYAKYQSVLDSTNLQWMQLRDDAANKSIN